MTNHFLRELKLGVIFGQGIGKVRIEANQGLQVDV